VSKVQQLCADFVPTLLACGAGRYGRIVARALRSEEAGAIYHAGVRGNARAPIFTSHSMYEIYLVLLGRTVEKFELECHAYCLMPNHVHLVEATPNANLARAMQWLNSTYARAFNDLHGRSGHVQQGRYWSRRLVDEPYAFAAIRYIELNPVRAGLVREPGDWPYSSYRAHAGLEPPPSFLTMDLFVEQLSADPRQARLLYREFVAGV
jgi:putative transposase